MQASTLYLIVQYSSIMASTSDPNTVLTENNWVMNTEALDRYAKGWSRGDINIIYPILENSYTFNMPGMEEPVKLQDFKHFFVQFIME